MKRWLRAALWLGATVAVVACSAIGWLADEGLLDRTFPVQDTRVVIPRGDTFADVARTLVDDGVVSNATSFRLLGKFSDKDVDVRAGAYLFPAHMRQPEVLRALLTGGAQVASWLTIPEGFTAEQIADRLRGLGVAGAGDFAHVARAASLNVDGARTRGLEGYLFPSTYLIDTDASSEQIAKQLTDQFFKELPRDAPARARALHVSIPQAVVVASLVEREAKIDADRPRIAGVIYNRLRDRMPLQVDATIEYALPAHKAELSFADLKIDSPYNTYLHEGLPPTPIANPGRPSLEAALHPAKIDALYYVYCGGGHHVFAKTLQEQDANVARCLK